MGSYVYFQCFFPELWSVNCPKKVHVLQCCADLRIRTNSVIAIYINASESSYYTLSENGMVYRV